MSQRVSLAVAALLPLLSALAACSGGPSVTPEPPELTGFWMFNEEESDDPQQALSMPGRPAGRGGAAMAGQAGIGIRITQTDSTVILDYIGGRDLTVYPDGRTIRRETPSGGTFSMEARWKDGKLVIERRMGRGMTMVQSVYLSDDGQQLYVKTTIESSRMGSVQIRRVYDARIEDGS